jgi:D-alanine-D-alanine ligase
MNIAILTGGISTEREVALRSAKNLKTWIENSGYTCISFDLPQEIDSFITQYKRFDSVIPLFHGKYGEDGQITAFLKTLGCNVAYSPFDTHALCIDKYRTNLVV